LPKIDRSPASPKSFRAQESTAVRADSLKGEARGHQEEAIRGLGRAGEPSEPPHAVGRELAEEVAAARSPHRPPPLEGKQNGITVSSQCRRKKPRPRWHTVAWHRLRRRAPPVAPPRELAQRRHLAGNAPAPSIPSRVARIRSSVPLRLIESQSLIRQPTP
jgi:hypothetical protein